MELAGPFSMPKSQRGARRQYDAIMRAVRKSLAGGLSFGLDWPTFRVSFPAACEHVRKIQSAYAGLPL